MYISLVRKRLTTHEGTHPFGSMASTHVQKHCSWSAAKGSTTHPLLRTSPRTKPLCTAGQNLDEVSVSANEANETDEELVEDDVVGEEVDEDASKDGVEVEALPLFNVWRAFQSAGGSSELSSCIDQVKDDEELVREFGWEDSGEVEELVDGLLFESDGLKLVGIEVAPKIHVPRSGSRQRERRITKSRSATMRTGDRQGRWTMSMSSVTD